MALDFPSEGLFYVPDLAFWLTSLLPRLKGKVLVLTNSEEQAQVLREDFPEIQITPVETFYQQDWSEETYDIIFFLGTCLPSLEISPLIISSTPSGQTRPISKEPRATIRYDDRYYSLQDRGELLQSMAREAAHLAYTNPDIRILLLTPTSTSAESVQRVLRDAHLPHPENILVTPREVGLLVANSWQPAYIFDSLITQEWVPTWTQGRRLRDVFVSQTEADVLYSSPGVVHRMITEEAYRRLPLIRKTQECLWRSWLLTASGERPLTVERCWSQLEPVLKEGEDFKNFLIQQPLGLRPSLVLWKWYQDGHPLFPMICLVALVDSYNATYLDYPQGAPLSVRRTYYERYYAPFTGESDLEVLLKIWLSLLGEDFQELPEKIESWAQEHRFSEEKMTEVYVVIRDLLIYFEELTGRQVKTETFDPKDFLEQATPYWIHAYADRLVTSSGGSLYRSAGNVFLRPSYEYTLSEAPIGETYAIVTHQEAGQCMLWLTVSPEKIEEKIVLEVV
jgi:hypothetical protein